MGSGIRDELIFVLPMFQAMFQTCFKHGGGQAAPCQLQGHSGRRTKEQSVAARASKFSLPMFQGMFQTCFKHRGCKTAPRERRRKRREEDEGGMVSITYKKIANSVVSDVGVCGMFQTRVSDLFQMRVSDTCFRPGFRRLEHCGFF